MRVIQPPAPLPALAGERVVFLAGSIDLGKSVDWQAELTLSLADCPGTLLNPRRSQWDENWRAEDARPWSVARKATGARATSTWSAPATRCRWSRRWKIWAAPFGPTAW